MVFLASETGRTKLYTKRSGSWAFQLLIPEAYANHSSCDVAKHELIMQSIIIMFSKKQTNKYKEKIVNFLYTCSIICDHLSKNPHCLHKHAAY